MALTFLVDNVAMTLLPSGVVELLPDPEVYQTSAGGQLVVHNDSPGMVEVRFGMEASRRDWVAEIAPDFYGSGEADEGKNAFLERREPDFSRLPR